MYTWGDGRGNGIPVYTLHDGTVKLTDEIDMIL